ncbi:GNAT family N-acetyltransferase [Oleiagrimonas sp. C23AA]|uniref:GNAT family N-acetyltransferase n=1 Tax=Oleiagrimonas sp. C23AA TaxID=2719047 RepID=UPI001980DAB9|nr:GNAT family N-acetyltransferase [Oleiagrimonas sp. C23AA]
MPAPRIDTERLVLRPPTAQDFEAWAAFQADPVAMAFMGGARSRAQAWRHFIAAVGAWVVQGHSLFSIIERESRQWIGTTGAWQPEGWAGLEVGWCIARRFQRRGYALEAAGAARDWAFAHLQVDEVVHYIPPGHDASRAVATRLGSQCRQRVDMPEPFAGTEVELWSQSRRDWQAARP